MELRSSCTKCTGIEKCTKYCERHLGSNLVNFINGIDVIETQIGEFRTNFKTNKIEYIVSGHSIENSGSPSYILSDLSTSIDASGKFISCGGKTPMQILKNYLDSLDIKDEVKESALATFKKFNSSKLLPIPLKPGSECQIVYEDANGKQVKAQSKIFGIKWLSEKSSGKLRCTIFCSVEKVSYFDTIDKIVKIPITDYGDKISLPQIERMLKTSEIDRSFIKMTDVGFIKPILIKDDKYTLAIDNMYLYRVVDNRTFIVGVWSNGKIKEVQGGIEPISSSKAYKKLSNAFNYIEKHRRFIVPYGLFELNKIEV